MSDNEVFMYSIIGSLSLMDAPIVFKGALVLKMLQYHTGNRSGLERETQDIDGDWVGKTPSMQYLISMLQQAVYNAGYLSVTVVAYREYAEGKSAGFKFIDENNKVIAYMDLGIKPNDSATRYSTIMGVDFYGQSVSKIIADKVVTVTSGRVFRRVKDLIDLYILSYIYSGTYNDIILGIKKYNIEVGDANELLTRVQDLKHAYDKYINKARVLPLEVVYMRVLKFLKPFLEFKGEYSSLNLVWMEDKGWQG